MYVFFLFITVKIITKVNLGHKDTFEMTTLKISRRGLPSPDNAEFGHFMLLFWVNLN